MLLDNKFEKIARVSATAKAYKHLKRNIKHYVAYVNSKNHYASNITFCWNSDSIRGNHEYQFIIQADSDLIREIGSEEYWSKKIFEIGRKNLVKENINRITDDLYEKTAKYIQENGISIADYKVDFTSKYVRWL